MELTVNIKNPQAKITRINMAKTTMEKKMLK